MLCDGLALPLLSVNFLTKELNYLVLHEDNRIFILKQIPNTITFNKNKNNNKNYSINNKNYRVIATATLNLHDRLFHVDDMTRFKDPSLLQSPSAYPSQTKPIVDDVHNNKEEVVKEIEEDLPADFDFYNLKDYIKGSTRVMIKSARQYLNLLEWLHVRLGHISPALIKWMVKNFCVLGVGVTWKEIAKLEMGICDACMHSHMHALPIYASLNLKVYGIFQYLTSDIVPFGFNSIRGFTATVLFACKASSKVWVYPIKRKSQWLSKLKQCIRENGKGVTPQAVELRYLLTDYATEVHSLDATNYLRDNNIELQNSAPYKHEQNLSERYIQTLWNMVRCSMYYNKVPMVYICYAFEYSADTHGMLCRIGETKTRDEVFYNKKTDVSKCVPFFSEGWYHVTKEERIYLNKNLKQTLKDKARNCIMLGYTNPYRLHDVTDAPIYIKDSYMCLTLDNTIAIRHDCYFKCYPNDLTTILHTSLNKREMEVDDVNVDIDKEYKQINTFEEMTNRTSQDPDSWENLHKSPTFDPQLVKYTDLPNPGNTVVTEPSPTIVTPAGVTNTNNNNNNRYTIIDEHRYTIPTTKPLSSPKRSGRKTTAPTKLNLLVINDNDSPLIKKLKTRANIESRKAKKEQRDSPAIDPKARDSYYDAKARKKVFIATATPKLKLVLQQLIDNKRLRKQTTIIPPSQISKENEKIKQIISSDNLNPAPDNFDLEVIEQFETDIDPRNMLEAFSGPDGQYWLIAYELELTRLNSRNTWEICDEFKGPEALDPDKPIKSKFAFRKTVKPDGTLKFRCRLVACGYSQIYGKDYDESYSPTAKYKSLCMIMHIAAIHDWHIAGIDVENAFVEPLIDKEIYMYLPKDVFETPQSGRRVKVRLTKSLYGLKQAGDLWNKLINNQFINMGFYRTAHDQCVYILKDIDTGILTIAVVYVDDILFFGNSKSLIDGYIKTLSDNITKLTEVDEVDRYIGVDTPI